MSATVPVVAVRGSTGISLNYGPPGYDLVTSFTRDDSKACKTMLFSQEGKYFAWVNGLAVKVVSTTTWKQLWETPRQKVSNIVFSPLGTYLMTWEPFIVSTSNPQGSPNFHIFKSETGELVKALVQKKQTGWEPQWTPDEQLCARLVNNEILFYENCNFDIVVNKFNSSKCGNFGLSPSVNPSYVLCFLPGTQGQPSFGKLFQYPKFDTSNSLANKSFFQADRVEVFWNKKATASLLMASSDYDKTGTSYYGKQTLHFLSIKGETSMVVSGGKEGPVHSAAWSPKSTEFCVVHGYMPSKATLFNLKCEPIADLGVGPRNCIYYNFHGNMLILGGFGNLQGGVEIWDVHSRRMISKVDAPDTTLLQWSPDSEHFLTATTAPRLRMGNGFKIWHYSGALLYERPWNKQEELWEVAWQIYPIGVFKEPQISAKIVEGIQPSQPVASKQVYRPPSARLKEDRGLKPKEEEDAQKADSSVSKKALQLRKKREAKRAKKDQAPDSPNSQTSTTQNQQTNHSNGIELETDDPEKLKKIKKLKSKLNEISRLKEQRSSGKQLELNQLEKIKKEEEITKELRELVL